MSYFRGTDLVSAARFQDECLLEGPGRNDAMHWRNVFDVVVQLVAPLYLPPYDAPPTRVAPARFIAARSATPFRGARAR